MLRDVLAREDRAHRKAAGDTLCRGYHIRRDAGPFMGKQLSRPTHTGLHFVQPQHQTELVASRTKVAQELQLGRPYPALALYRLDNDAGPLGADRVAHRVHVVEWNVVESVDSRAEAGKVFRIAGSRGGRGCAAGE